MTIDESMEQAEADADGYDAFFARRAESQSLLTRDI